MEQEIDLSILKRGIPCDPLPQWDSEAPLDQSVPHAPARPVKLDPEEKKVSQNGATFTLLIAKPQENCAQT